MKKSIATGIVTAGVIVVIGGASLYQAACVKRDSSCLQEKGVTAKYTAMLGDESSSNCLVDLSEKESLLKDKTIIGGVVKGSKDLVFSNGKENKNRTLATIQISKGYQGNEKKQEVHVLLPCTGMDGKETSVVSKVREGMSGIFLLERFENGEYEEDVDGSRIYLSGIAEYGMKNVVSGLQQDATMEEIEEYVRQYPN